MGMSLAFLASALLQFGLGLVIAWILGPTAFGAYALAIAAGILIQTLLFDWIRLGVTRFAGTGGSGFRAGLDAAIGRLSLLCLGMAGLAWLFGGAHRALLALVPLVALAGGAAEYVAADLRANFRQRRYGMLVAARAALSILLLPLAAWWFRSPEATVLAFVAALLGATLPFLRRRTEQPDPASEAAASPGESNAGLRMILRYSWPIILTNLAYLALFLALRSWVARDLGLAAAGQFSLALDVVSKLMMTLGTALDLFLFQVAVREAATASPDRVLKRLRLNAEMTVAALMAALIGGWLVLPSIEVLMIAPAFRQSFGTYFTMLVPGMILYGVIQYALHPFQQIRAQTLPLARAALAGIAIGLAILPLGRQIGITLPIWIGLVLFLSMVIAAMILRLQSGQVFGNEPRDGLRIATMLAIMTAAGLLGRTLDPGGWALATTMLLGGVAALGSAYLLDIGQIRLLLRLRALPPV